MLCRFDRELRVFDFNAFHARHHQHRLECGVSGTLACDYVLHAYTRVLVRECVCVCPMCPQVHARDCVVHAYKRVLCVCKCVCASVPASVCEHLRVCARRCLCACVLIRACMCLFRLA